MSRPSRPIVLWQPSRSTTTDDACTTIVKSVLSPPCDPGPYEHNTDHGTPVQYVPSLAYFAIRKLIDYPDQIDLGSVRIYYQNPRSASEYDILSALLPGFTDPNASFSLTQVDPRLWAVIVQVFANLPKHFHTYPIPLSDKHLPLLQRVSCTPHFCLITVLDLPGCTHLTDQTISELKALHALCALDASSTQLSSLGVRRLSGTLLRDESPSDELRGPWRLRMLRLVDCKRVDNTVFDAINAFPLLCVVDLQGTMCFPSASIPHGYSPGSKEELFHPTPIIRSLNFLASDCEALFSAPATCLSTCHVTTLHHKKRVRSTYRYPPAISTQDVCVVFPPPASFVPTTRANPIMERNRGSIDACTILQQTEMKDSLPRDRLANQLRNQDFWLMSPNRLVGRPQERHRRYPHHDARYWSDQEAFHVDGSKRSEESHERECTQDTESDSDEIREGQNIDDTSQHHDNRSFELPSNFMNYPTDATPEHLASVRSCFTSGLISSTANGIRPQVSSPRYSSASHNATSVLPKPDGSTNSVIPEGEDAASVRPESMRAVQVDPDVDNNSTNEAPFPNPRPTKRRRMQVYQPNVWDDRGVVPASAAANPGQSDVSSTGQDASSNRIWRTSEAAAGIPNNSARREHFSAAPQSVSSNHSIAELPLPPSREINDSHPLHLRNMPGENHSPLSTGSSDSSDIQNGVAETETSEHSSREAARAFYSHLPPRGRILAQARQTLRAAGRTRGRDELLRLYRDPPAWSVLDTWEPSKKNIKDRTHGTAVLNRSNSVGKQGLQALAEMINRKRIFTAEEQPTKATKVLQSRNPFRVKSNASASSPKPLVPISTLLVPSLPREMLDNATVAPKLGLSDSGQQEHKRPASNCLAAEQAPLDGKSASDIPSFKLPSTSRGGKAATRKSSGDQRSKPTQTADFSTRVVRRTSGPQRRDKGSYDRSTFDWKAWSKK